ncbi:unnamed protein product [Brassica rapa]|uniref:Uncharacterized protein n=1 Tax=Brassica campestris TaxID=3711 RepID=A0A8D9DGR9_BRACM|nr:unnamed protein product [Brassica rapa]
MDPVIIVSDNWIKKNKYVFNVDSRGCKVLNLDEKTTHEDFVKSKIERLRLCVEITENRASEKSKTLLSFGSEAEASVVESRDENYSGSYDGCSLEKKQEDNENDCSSNVEGEKHDVVGEDEIGEENEEDDEFESRFDMFDDSDGASSYDDNFSSYGESPTDDEDSPMLPPKKRYQNFSMSGSKGNLEVLSLVMSSIDIAVGQRMLYKNFLGDVGPAVRPTIVGIAITKQFGIKVITLLWLSYF